MTIYGKKYKKFQFANFSSLLFRVILICLNPDLVLNTNEVEGLIANGPFFDHIWRF